MRLAQFVGLASSCSAVAFIVVFGNWASPEPLFYKEIGSSVTRCPFSRLVHSPGCPASVNISSRNLGIAIVGSQLTGLARLSYNRKVDFVTFN